MTNVTPESAGALRITRDTPVGFELIGVKKKAAIQLMGSRLWGRFNPNHWDPVYAAETGLKAPIQTGRNVVGLSRGNVRQLFRRRLLPRRTHPVQVCRLHPRQ